SSMSGLVHRKTGPKARPRAFRRLTNYGPFASVSRFLELGTTIMAWLNREKAPLQKGARTDTPDGLWERCTSCNEIILTKDFRSNQSVCPKCNHHFPIGARERLQHFLDPGT